MNSKRLIAVGKFGPDFRPEFIYDGTYPLEPDPNPPISYRRLVIIAIALLVIAAWATWGIHRVSERIARQEKSPVNLGDSTGPKLNTSDSALLLRESQPTTEDR